MDDNPYLDIKQTKLVSVRHDVYLSGEIGEPRYYTDLIHVLRSAHNGDIVNIFINSPGGRLDTGVQLLNAIAACEAKVNTVLDGVAYSMASFILLAGNEIHIMPNSQLMIHNFCSGYRGKASDVSLAMTADVDHFKLLCQDYYKSFLTKKEIAEVLDGKDFWMLTDEIIRRLSK